MTDRELMQQALEALEEISGGYSQNLIVALRERLAQPEQKPVAWGVFDGPNLHDTFFTEEDAQYMARLKGDGSVVQPLYTAPPQRKPEQPPIKESSITHGHLWIGDLYGKGKNP